MANAKLLTHLKEINLYAVPSLKTLGVCREKNNVSIENFILVLYI